MDLMIGTFIGRARNELLIAEKLYQLSKDADTRNFLKIPQNEFFYSSVISHSYYAIFYSVKAVLLTKEIRTFTPEVHRKTYEEFEKHFVKTGILDAKLLEIYKEMIIKADYLLGIFKDLKAKRGKFTYDIIPQANQQPAESSLKNSNIFVSNIIKVIEDGG